MHTGVGGGGRGTGVLVGGRSGEGKGLSLHSLLATWRCFLSDHIRSSGELEKGSMHRASNAPSAPKASPTEAGLRATLTGVQKLAQLVWQRLDGALQDALRLLYDV